MKTHIMIGERYSIPCDANPIFDGTAASVHANECNCQECFDVLVKQHDLTYMYSDDAAVYRRGDEQYRRIRTISGNLDPEFARRIWNEMVDERLAAGYRKQFYWRA